MTMWDTLMLKAARRSWAVRQRAAFGCRLDTPGGVIRLEITRGVGWAYLRWRRLGWMVRVFSIAHRLRPDGLIVDVGANVGQTLIAAREAAPDARYLGFEPLPDEYGFVSRMIALNRWGQSRVLPLALSDRAGVATLLVGDDSSTSSLEPDARWRHTMVGTVDVVTMTGDEALARAEAGPIAVIKIDVEGHEPAVLAGLHGTLELQRPPLLLEVMPVSGGADLRRAQDMTRLLLGHGYALGRLRLDGRVEWGDTLVRAPDPSDPDDIRDINWLAVPIGQKPAFS